VSALRYLIVLFDAGDTLIGPKESFGGVYARVLKGLGVDLSGDALERALRAQWAEINAGLTPGVNRYGMYAGGEQEYWLRFVQGTLARVPGLPLDPTLPARALTPLRDAFRDPSAWQVFGDVPPVLNALKSMGVKMGIVSNWDSRLPGLLEDLGLARWFDVIVVSSAEGIEKPDPELFLRAVVRLQGTPRGALHVGDMPELDEAGARAAGIDSVLVDRRGRLVPDGRALRDLSALPGIVRGDDRPTVRDSHPRPK
jgi:putative hydrolase of the HAD superfamily